MKPSKKQSPRRFPRNNKHYDTANREHYERTERLDHAQYVLGMHFRVICQETLSTEHYNELNEYFHAMGLPKSSAYFADFWHNVFKQLPTAEKALASAREFKRLITEIKNRTVS